MNIDNHPDTARPRRSGLAAISSQDLPPASVRSAVMAEFRRVNKTVPIRRPFIKWSALAAAAAVLLLAIFVATRHAPEKKTVVRMTPRVEAPVPAPVVVAPAVKAAAPRPVKRRKVVKAPTSPPPVEPAPEVATDFFEIPYAEPLRPQERVDVFRMQIPRANIAAFGLPVAGGRLDSRVTADVLVGEDGVMRAIRFIR